MRGRFRQPNMDEFQKTIAEGGNDAYRIFAFIHEQSGRQFREGGSEGLRLFLHWYDLIKETENTKILELFLWKFFVYLPKITQFVVSEKFRRRGLEWELRHVEDAAHFRKEPSDGELSSPPIEHAVWTSTPTKDHTKRPVSRAQYIQLPILVLIALTTICLIGICATSLLSNSGVWRLFLIDSINFYRTSIREPLLDILGVVYPPVRVAATAGLFDLLICWSLLYVSFLVLNVFGKREIVTLAILWGIPAARIDPKRTERASFHDILRHCFVWITGPLVLILCLVSYGKVWRDHIRAVSHFHINVFKVYLASRGISLVRFDDAIEIANWANRCKDDARKDIFAISRAVALYLAVPIAVILAMSLRFIVTHAAVIAQSRL
jgi:hypothetical protein